MAKNSTPISVSGTRTPQLPIPRGRSGSYSPTLYNVRLGTVENHQMLTHHSWSVAGALNVKVKSLLYVLLLVMTVLLKPLHTCVTTETCYYEGYDSPFTLMWNSLTNFYVARQLMVNPKVFLASIGKTKQYNGYLLFASRISSLIHILFYKATRPKPQLLTDWLTQLYKFLCTSRYRPP